MVKSEKSGGRMEDGGWRRRVRGSIRAALLSFILIPLSANWASSLMAQEVGLTASSERKTLRLGEPVVVTVTARVPAAIDTLGPIVADSAGLFQVLSVAKTDDREWAFELMTIDTGTVFVPPLAFGYTVKGDTTGKRAYANALSFQVAGIMLPKDADIKDIKPPMSAPWKWEDLWPFLLLAVAAALGIYLYRRYRKKKGLEPEPQPEAPTVAPHVRALGELRMLEERQLWQQGKVKEYYSEATEIVRRFFEGRWHIPALEMTSEEILLALRDTPEAAQMRESLGTFFVRADLVKFAKAQPTPEEHQEELAAAYAIVRTMTPVEAPVTAKETTDVR